jgi:NAD+ synthase
MIEQIVEWIKRQVSSAGARGAVFGMSGGLDSAVVAALCGRALAGDALGIIMPCMSRSCDADDALVAAEAAGVNTMTINLAPPLESMLASLPRGCEAAVSNLKPRLRMAALYFVANDRGMLVVGTSNKSERSVGYFTKYGDGGADICPLAGIYKTDLYTMAVNLGVPQSILEKPPSAGLWEGQTDEGEMGITYRELDSILKALEQGRVPSEDPGTVERVRKMMCASEHKRSAVPIFEPNGSEDGKSPGGGGA